MISNTIIKENLKTIFKQNPVILKIFERIGWLNGRYHCKIGLGRKIRTYKKTNKAAVFLVFTPQHRNLGDHAIAIAEKQLLDRCKIPYFEVTGAQLWTLDYYGMLSIFDKSIILVSGGGNLGSLWPFIENLNRDLVSQNPNASIYILPNSIYYGNTESEKQDFEYSKQIYNTHKKLSLYAREQISYEIMQAAYQNVKLIPDMALSLKTSISTQERHGCLLCFRSDIESTLTEEDLIRIRLSAESLFGEDIEITDTVLERDITIDERESVLKSKLTQFCSAELVITDRLHGMVFCAITGTNCIFFSGKSPKIIGCYNWVKHLNYIRPVNNVDEIVSTYIQIPKEEHHYDNANITKLIEELEKDLIKATASDAEGK